MLPGGSVASMMADVMSPKNTTKRRLESSKQSQFRMRQYPRLVEFARRFRYICLGVRRMYCVCEEAHLLKKNDQVLLILPRTRSFLAFSDHQSVYLTRSI